MTPRDERGAAFMADTYGALTGKAGVCLATLGPGAIKLLLRVATDPLPVNVPRDPSPSADQVHRAAHVLAQATHPVVLAGAGVARDHAMGSLLRFSERLQVPVATTFLGKGVFPDDHPNALGTIGFMAKD